MSLWVFGKSGRESDYNSVEISGWLIEFSKAVDTESFFKEKEFYFDGTNSGDATLKSAEGYQKDNVICKVNHLFNEPNI